MRSWGGDERGKKPQLSKKKVAQQWARGQEEVKIRKKDPLTEHGWETQRKQASLKKPSEVIERNQPGTLDCKTERNLSGDSGTPGKSSQREQKTHQIGNDYKGVGKFQTVVKHQRAAGEE